MSVSPDSVMYMLSACRRRLHADDGHTRDVEIESGTTGWLPAQRHAGENIGDTPTHVIFVELKHTPADVVTGVGPVGPVIAG